VRDGRHHGRSPFGSVIGIHFSGVAETAQWIRMGDQAVTATLNNSDAALDLATMLPLFIRMRDHQGRQK
jgi:hypothetical protein